MKLVKFLKKHPFGALAFIFAITTSVVGNYVYDFIHQAEDQNGGNKNNAPIINIVKVPSQGGGPDSRGVISGRVEGVDELQAYRIVIYALTDHWYVQPTETDPLTMIDANGEWVTQTHLGTSYAALLVEKSYTPPSQPEFVPQGKEVLSRMTVGAHISP